MHKETTFQACVTCIRLQVDLTVAVCIQNLKLQNLIFELRLKCPLHSPQLIFSKLFMLNRIGNLGLLV